MIAKPPGEPAAIALTADPASILCDGTNSSTVTAKVTDAAGNNVVDGTPVTFSVIALGTANPIITSTSDGTVSSTVTPVFGATAGITVKVTSGRVASSIRIDCVAPIGTLFVRSAWRVLGVLLQPPFVPHQQKEIARVLELPEASVQRGLRTLVEAGLVQRKRKQYVVSVGQDAIRYLWLLRQAERYSALPPALVNSLSVVLAREFSPDDCVIVFGSWARGVAVPGESDVDVAVFTTQSARVGPKRLFEGAHRFDIHIWDIEELRQPANSAALDAVLNGIPITRREAVYDVLVDLRWFPKSFLLYRLQKADELLFSAELYGPGTDAATFFTDMAERMVAQVRSILEHGRTVSWREVAREASLHEAIADLGARLAREGDQIWLT